MKLQMNIVVDIPENCEKELLEIANFDPNLLDDSDGYNIPNKIAEKVMDYITDTIDPPDDEEKAVFRIIDIDMAKYDMQEKD